MAIRSDHHGDLDVLVPESGDAPGPLAFDRSAPFKPQAEHGEEGDGVIEGLHHDANVVHPLESHVIEATIARSRLLARLRSSAVRRVRVTWLRLTSAST